MDALAGFDFVDCLLTDFGTDGHMKEVSIECEVYFPAEPGSATREFGLLRLVLSGCLQIRMEATREFWKDLERPYNGSRTLKANEISNIELRTNANSAHELKLESDMLQLSIVCDVASISRGELKGGDSEKGTQFD